MAVIATTSFAKAIWPGINAWWGKAYEEHEEEYKYLFDSFPSSKAYEEDVGVSSFGLAPVKDEGGSVLYDEEEQAYVTRYTNVAYGLGFIITREIYEDDLYDVVGQRRAQGLAYSMRQTKEENAANVYNRAFNSEFVGGDGVSLLNTAHPLWAGGTASNRLSPDADLSESSLEQAVIDLMKYTDDRGLKIAVRPDLLIVPTDLCFEAERILYSPYRVGTSNNDLNAIYSKGIFPRGYVVNHYLTDSSAWFVRTTTPHGMKHFVRREAEFTIDNDFDTENAKFKATERYSFGWSDWRGLYGSEGE